MSLCRRLIPVCLAGALLAACQSTPIPETRVGLNEPPPGEVRALTWPAVTGASHYQATVYMDRGATQPVGVAGFTSATHVPLDRIAWQEGHPIADRQYFAYVRAYDRPETTGLLLATRGPVELTIGGLFPSPTP